MKNYFGLPKEYVQYDDAKIVILPIPFDETASWLKGAAKGPEAILESSQQVELYDIETNSEIYKQGIFSARSLKVKTSEALIKKSYDQAKKFLADNKFLVTIGGEHSVSIGPLRAHVEKYPNISILHFDAHADFRDEYEDNKYNHACVMARAQEFTRNIVSVGIRSMDITEKNMLDEKRLFLADDIFALNEKWIEKVIEQLNDKVYISFDVDVFEIGLMPSTGTPEPGGLTWYQVINCLKKVSQECQIVGFDLVELAPNPYNKAPDFLCAKLLYKILSYSF
ncbi:MAG: agmatinase [Gammaproteobacteria bacterium]